MEKWEGNDDLVNAYLVDLLVELRVVEAAPLMEQAFAADSVDVFLRGDWEDVQVDLGLLEKRRTTSPRPSLFPKLDPFAGAAVDAGPAPRRTSDVARAKKNKRKQQKESRKKNRRRK
jgi:hypothetical protein